MRLKNYTAPTMSDAMAMVRGDMGDAAIIVSTQVDADDGLCWVTAALEDDAEIAEETPPPHDAAPMDPAERHDFLAQVLTAHGLPQHLTERMLRDCDIADETADAAMAYSMISAQPTVQAKNSPMVA